MTDTRTTLLDAAEAAVRLRGYHAVSFRDLADQLQIKSASVHYYFRQKEDLGLALVARYRERFFENLERRASGADMSTARIKAFCATYRAALLDDDRICLCGMLGAETRGLPGALSDAVGAFLDANVDWVEAALGGKTERSRALQIVSALQGAMIVSRTLNDDGAFDRVVDEIMASVD
ncbi:MAG: TetR family transcriptional regulator [Pseudomonadota bacterium]